MFPTLDAFRDLAQARSVKIEVADFRAIPPARLDADAFRQAIFNLVDNAIRYSHANTAVEIQGRFTGGLIQIDVTNHGLGISPQEVEHIFEEGFRAKIAQRHQPSGTGLGLPVAMRLLRAQGCDLSLIETAPKTVFRITIPESMLERRGVR